MEARRGIEESAARSSGPAAAAVEAETQQHHGPTHGHGRGLGNGANADTRLELGQVEVCSPVIQSPEVKPQKWVIAMPLVPLNPVDPINEQVGRLRDRIVSKLMEVIPIPSDGCTGAGDVKRPVPNVIDK
jgi:hypothetical protein